MSLSLSLKRLGFAPLSRSVFWCRAGRLIHAVVISRDRHGDTAVSPVVWHSSMMGDGEMFRPSSIQSPVSGNVSPFGVDSSWTWKAGDLDAALVVSILKLFFSRFATMEDVNRCLDGAFVTPFFQARLAHGTARPDVDALVSSSATYATVGGAVDRGCALATGKMFLTEMMSPLGFSLAKSEEVVVVRKNAEMYDCVRLTLDQFGTFATITCFPWTTKVWNVDKRWKGIYYPMLRQDVFVGDRPFLINLSRLTEIDVAKLRLLIEPYLADFASVSDARAFAERLGSQWSTLASSLLRIA